jgi:hypothetical protein
VWAEEGEGRKLVAADATLGRLGHVMVGGQVAAAYGDGQREICRVGLVREVSGWAWLGLMLMRTLYGYSTGFVTAERRSSEHMAYSLVLLHPSPDPQPPHQSRDSLTGTMPSNVCLNNCHAITSSRVRGFNRFLLFC